MSDLLFNIRFGARHFQVGTRPWRVSFRVNGYWLENKPKNWFCVYTLFGKHF